VGRYLLRKPRAADSDARYRVIAQTVERASETGFVAGLQALPTRHESLEDAARLLHVAMTRATHEPVRAAHGSSAIVASEGLAGWRGAPVRRYR
jgi:hypothetical protein